MKMFKRYFIFSLLFSFSAIGGIDFSLGDKIRVLSDKGYRFSSENKFIAEGNVIIVSDENTLYGNKASIFLDQNNFKIEEDVKLVNPEFSLLGESFEYNNVDKTLNLMRAIIFTDNYKVVGENATRKGKGDIRLKSASYTTCKDCPNSWSFKGDEISITPGDYVRIKGAYFVINGVNVLYLPYFFFPIKKERESGLLFPRFSINLNDGTFLQLPYFQTLGDTADVTLSPTIWGRWGYGGELEFRKAFSDRNILVIESKVVDESTDEGKLVHLSKLDFSLWSEDERLKLFGSFDISNDYNSIRRFERFIDQEYSRPDFGGEIKMGYTGDLLEVSLLASQRANLIGPKSSGIDTDYIQVLPNLRFDFASLNILKGKGLPSVNSSFSLLFSQFRQGEMNQEVYSRNADRLIADGVLDVFYKPFSQYVNISSRHQFRNGFYDLKYDDGRESFEKFEIFHFFNLELPLVKKFEIKSDEISNENLTLINEKKKSRKFISNEANELIESESISKNINNKESTVFSHFLNFNINYHHLGNATYKGKSLVVSQFVNENFSPNTVGLFDLNDSFLTFENGVQANSTLSALQRTNTLELLVVNKLFKDSFNLTHKTGTQYLGGLNISQGFLLKNKFVDQTKLSRLLISGNTNLFGWDISLQDSYFHDSKEHLLNLSLSNRSQFTELEANLIYDSRTVPYNKILNSRLGIFLNQEVKLTYQFSYDISVDELNYENYLLRYLPQNDCWFIELNYFTDKIQSRYAVNFMLNLNEAQFKRNARL